MHPMLVDRLLPLVKREWPILVLLALFGMLYSTTLDSYGMFMWDEAEYASLARSVVRGEGFAISGVPHALRPPVLPLAGAAGMLLTGEQADDFVLRAVACTFALVALLCVYAFAAAAFDRTTGLLAAASLGTSPFFWTFVPYFMCEIPFMAFFAATVWFFWLGAYRSERFFVWSWICCALAILTRYTAVLFLPILILFVPIAALLGGTETRRRLASHAFFFSPLAGLVLLLPWLIRQTVTFGTPLAGLNWVSRQLQLYLPGVSMPWSFYLRLLPSLLSPAIMVLVATGVIWGFWKRDRFVLHSIAAAALILTWFSCYRYKEDRLVSSALPFLAAIAAVPLAKATAKLRPLVRYAALVFVLVGMFLLNYRVTHPIFAQNITLGYPSFLDAMAFLRVHGTPGSVVLGANGPQINWYSGLRGRDFPKEEGALPDALRSSEWVVITNFERGQRPYVLALMNRVACVGMPPDCAAEFRDLHFATMVIRSDRLQRTFVK